MSFQAYLDNIKTKTGKTPADFRALAQKKGLLKPGTKPGEIVAWLKADFGLGHGHAMAIVYVLKNVPPGHVKSDDAIATLFAGNKAAWRKPYDTLMKKIGRFGKDVVVSPNLTYINVLRRNKKFAIVQISASRLDIGIKLKGVAPTKRFQAAGSWNVMTTHRVRISDPKQIDAELLAWLKQAYDAA